MQGLGVEIYTNPKISVMKHYQIHVQYANAHDNNKLQCYITPYPYINTPTTMGDLERLLLVRQ